MLKDYPAVARQANLWSTDTVLSPRKRVLARNLSELAEVLADGQYGCAAEHYAAAEMYCTLCKSVTAGLSPARPACPGPLACPHHRAPSDAHPAN